MLELLGGLGIMLPGLTRSSPFRPTAALGLDAIQAVAVIVIPMNMVLPLAALFVAFFRFAAL